MNSHPTPQPAFAEASSALQGIIEVPGDKSISHRALILGLLSRGITEIHGLLEGEDVLNTAKACAALGAKIQKKAIGHYEVSGMGVGSLLPPQEPLDFGNSGTGVRLMMGVVAGHDISCRFTGDTSLCKRPMQRVLTPLQLMGVSVEDAAEGGRLPLTLRGTSLSAPITYELPVASAQVKSAILLAALNTPGRTTVIEREATRDHTERMLQAFGAKITTTKDQEGCTHIVLDGEAELQAQKIIVPGDPSSAAFPLVAALLVAGSRITIRNVMMNDTRTGLFKTLREMGAHISELNRRNVGGEDVADLSVEASLLHAVDVPSTRAPSMIDEYPIAAVAASFAKGTTRFRGLSELRAKESDRLAAIHKGLIANGVKAEIEGDDLIIEGAEKVAGGAIVTTHMDHRIAMSFLVMGLVTEQKVGVDDVGFIATSFPNFVSLMQGMGANIA